MSSTVDIQELRNEVLRKLGRNLLVFQHIESLLKFFVSSGSVSANLGEFMSTLSYQQESVRKKMMGQLIDPLMSVLYERKVNVEVGQDLQEVQISVSMGLDSDSESVERHRESLEFVIQSRNELVHHFFPRVQSGSIEDWLAAGLYLDEQRKLVLPELEFLAGVARALSEGLREQQYWVESADWNTLLKE